MKLEVEYVPTKSDRMSANPGNMPEHNHHQGEHHPEYGVLNLYLGLTDLSQHKKCQQYGNYYQYPPKYNGHRTFSLLLSSGAFPEILHQQDGKHHFPHVTSGAHKL